MLKLKKVAVTGGLACGKSTVCRFFRDLGAKVISADEIVHQLLSPTTALGQKVIKLLGPNVVSNNQIDRSKVAERVFQQPELLRALEEILHPAVYEEMKRLYKKVSESKPDHSLFVAEIPLLFEAGFESFFDTTITVVAAEELCYERFQQSTGGNKDEYALRSARQLDIKEKAARADYILVNNGTLAELKNSVNQMFNNLTQARFNGPRK